MYLRPDDKYCRPLIACIRRFNFHRLASLHRMRCWPKATQLNYRRYVITRRALVSTPYVLAIDLRARSHCSIITRTLTRLCECCKGDHQSQWERVNFGPQPTLSPLTDRHQIWITWLCRRHLPSNKIWAQSVQGVLLPIYAKYTPSNLRMFTSLFSWFFRSPIIGEAVGRILTLNTSYNAVLRKEVPFGG